MVQWPGQKISLVYELKLSLYMSWMFRIKCPESKYVLAWPLQWLDHWHRKVSDHTVLHAVPNATMKSIEGSSWSKGDPISRKAERIERIAENLSALRSTGRIAVVWVVEPLQIALSHWRTWWPTPRLGKLVNPQAELRSWFFYRCSIRFSCRLWLCFWCARWTAQLLEHHFPCSGMCFDSKQCTGIAGGMQGAQYLVAAIGHTKWKMWKRYRYNQIHIVHHSISRCIAPGFGILVVASFANGLFSSPQHTATGAGGLTEQLLGGISPMATFSTFSVLSMSCRRSCHLCQLHPTSQVLSCWKGILDSIASPICQYPIVVSSLFHIFGFQS